MTIGLVALTLLMAAIVWWLFRQSIGVQPWEAEAVGPDLSARIAARPAAKNALWVFLAVATSLFVLFVSAYSMRLTVTDWQPLPRPRVLLFDTGLLIAASIAMQWTVHAARKGDLAQLRLGLGASGVLSLGFLAGQLYAWTQMHAAGHFVASSAATGFFYLLTGAHGLHVLGGLVAWARAMARTWRGTATPQRIRLGVELCATYWHFLLVVWLVLYALLVSDRIGLPICSQGAL